MKASSVGIPDRPWLLSHSFQQLSLRFLERPSYKHSSIVSLFFLFKNPESDRTKIRKREREREALDFKWELNTQHIYIYIHREERGYRRRCAASESPTKAKTKRAHTHNKKKRSSRSWTSKPQQGPFKEIGKSLFSRLLLLWNCLKKKKFIFHSLVPMKKKNKWCRARTHIFLTPPPALVFCCCCNNNTLTWYDLVLPAS